ncbi:MAG: type II secretion system F family protein [Phycisphaerae bacterium]|nr:type II secretion system F family protein [Phycisphaerae bacterium]
MGTFTYEAMNRDGQSVKAEVSAISSEEALSKIRNLGLFPTRIREKGGKKKPGEAVAGKKKKGGGTIAFGKVGQKTVVQFTRQLSTLQDAGLPILRSLQILHEQQKPGLMRNILHDVADDVEGGATLSEAFAKHPKGFNRLYVNMVAAGETGGVLDVILQRLAEFMEKSQRLKRKVTGAMVYPICVISFAVGIVAGIMIVVVPKFEEIFRDFGTTLPSVTKMLIGVANWFVKASPPGWAVLLVSPIALVLVLKLVRQSKGGRYVADAASLKIPVLGQILEKTSVARFTRTLGTLINAGVPILEAINITKDTSGNEVYARALGSVHDAIREGDSFANPLRSSKVCDSIVVNMIDVGEETGDLDKMLMKVADNYDEEVDILVGSLVSLLEPILVVCLGTLVGFIVVALFLPLVSLIESVSG